MTTHRVWVLKCDGYRVLKHNDSRVSWGERYPGSDNYPSGCHISFGHDANQNALHRSARASGWIVFAVAALCPVCTAYYMADLPNSAISQLKGNTS